MKQQVVKKRGRPPKAKSLQAAKAKPQKPESVRAVLKRAGKDRRQTKRAKKEKQSTQSQVAAKEDVEGAAAVPAEFGTQDPVQVPAAQPAQAKHASSVTDYITGSWTYLSEMVRGVRYGQRH
ncbi:g1755 [Coccomyxa elongata]